MRAEEQRLQCSHCSYKHHCNHSHYVNNNNNTAINRKEPKHVMQDIYGNKVDNSDGNSCILECGICLKQVSAVRFAPHLEKCMGIGGRLVGGRGSSASGGVSKVLKPSKLISPTDCDGIINSFSNTAPNDSPQKKQSPQKKHKKTVTTATLTPTPTAADLTTPNGSVSLLDFAKME